jgi:hypothetical protein
METTYSHLSGDDHIQRAEEAWGIREPENDSPLTPEVCDVCGNPLGPSAKACERCGTVFTPDAKSVQEQIDGDMTDSYKQTDPDDTETMDKIDKLDELLEDPEVQAALLEKMGDE